MELTDITNEMAALRKHHLTLNFLAVAVAAVVLFFGGWAVSHTLQSYDQQLAKADARYEQFQTTFSKAQADWMQHEKDRDATTKQQSSIESGIAQRDHSTNGHIAEVTAPNRTDAQVANDSAMFLGVKPTFTPDKLFAFTRPDVQGFVATKLDRDRLSLTVDNKQQELTLERSKVASLGTDLSAAQTSLSEAKLAIAGYSKIAKHSRLQKIGGVVLKGALFVGGIYLGKHL